VWGQFTPFYKSTKNRTRRGDGKRGAIKIIAWKARRKRKKEDRRRAKNFLLSNYWGSMSSGKRSQ